MNHAINPSNLTPPNVLPKGSDVYRVNVNTPDVTSSVVSDSATSSIKKRSFRKRKLQGSVPFVQYDASKEPVELATLLDEISTTIRRFVILDKNQADTAALWVAHTYVADLFDTSPLAIIDAPERACAKTLYQTVLANMSFRALSSSNATSSALFRSVELWQPTIFFDEADTFFKDKQDLHGMVNAGYKNGGSILRTETIGDLFEPRSFSVFGPKSIAGIALDRHLPDSTMSRGIVFKMRRKLPGEKVERMRHAEKGLFDKLCSKLVRFAEDYSEQLLQVRPVLPEALSDRAQDNWEPLLSIAYCAGEEWFARATSAALKLSRVSDESVSTGNELLSDIQQIFEKKADSQHPDKISTGDLITALIGLEEGPWGTYNLGHPITPKQLAKQLKAYGIKSKTVRMDRYSTPKGYELEQFADAFVRYLTPAAQDDMEHMEELSDGIRPPFKHTRPEDAF